MTEDIYSFCPICGSQDPLSGTFVQRVLGLDPFLHP